MLEASGFDFRNRYPQDLVIKLVKLYQGDKMTLGRTAYNITLDLYRTLAPLKQTTTTMALACVELAGRILGQHVIEIETLAIDKRFCTSREEVMGEPKPILLISYVIRLSYTQRPYSICSNCTANTRIRRW